MSPIAATSEAPAGAASPARFGVLAAYCCASFLCAGAWNMLAPIYAIAQERFRVSQGAVTLIAESMFLTYIPGSVLALFLTARHGLRATLLTGAALQCAMCALKWAGVALCAAPHGAYALLLAGQLLGGLGQPLILNVVARLTMDWCGLRDATLALAHVHALSLLASLTLRTAAHCARRFPPAERDLATLVGYQASNAGAMVFNALPAWLVRRPDDLAGLMLLQLLPWVALIAAMPRLLPSDTPAEAPSAAAAVQWAARRTAAAALPAGVSPGGAAVAALRRDLTALARHRNFAVLAAVFSLVAGMTWALPTVEGQLIEPCGYSPRLAGGAGAALLGGGVVSCLAAAPLLTPGRRGYTALQRRLVFAAAATTLLVMAANRPGQPGAVLLAWGALGCAQGPLGPVTLEHAAEMTFPMSADSSSAALFIASNLWSFMQVSVLARLLMARESQDCSAAATPAAAFVAVCMALGVALAAGLREESRRAAAERGDTETEGAEACPQMPAASIEQGDDAPDAPLLTRAEHRAAAAAADAL